MQDRDVRKNNKSTLLARPSPKVHPRETLQVSGPHLRIIEMSSIPGT